MLRNRMTDLFLYRQIDLLPGITFLFFAAILLCAAPAYLISLFAITYEEEPEEMTAEQFTAEYTKEDQPQIGRYKQVDEATFEADINSI